MLLWLFKADPSSNHMNAWKKHEPTTGNWFLQGVEYAEWKTTPSSLLWVYGSLKFYKNVCLICTFDRTLFETVEQDKFTFRMPMNVLFNG